MHCENLENNSWLLLMRLFVFFLKLTMHVTKVCLFSGKHMWGLIGKAFSIGFHCKIMNDRMTEWLWQVPLPRDFFHLHLSARKYRAAMKYWREALTFEGFQKKRHWNDVVLAVHPFIISRDTVNRPTCWSVFPNRYSKQSNQKCTRCMNVFSSAVEPHFFTMGLQPSRFKTHHRIRSRLSSKRLFPGTPVAVHWDPPFWKDHSGRKTPPIQRTQYFNENTFRSNCERPWWSLSQPQPSTNDLKAIAFDS